MPTQLWTARSLIPDRLPLRYFSRKPRTIDYCKPRQRYPIWRYRPQYVRRYSVYQIKLHLVFQRIQAIETPSCEGDTEEAEAFQFFKTYYAN